jgi:Lar family restriction alleviation protein
MIKECPFCGQTGSLIDALEACNEGGVVVECHSCHASGPVVFGVKDDPNPHAIAAWNRRNDTVAIATAQAVQNELALTQEFLREAKERIAELGTMNSGKFVDLSLLGNKVIIERLKELRMETDGLIRECRLRGGQLIIEAAKA